MKNMKSWRVLSDLNRKKLNLAFKLQTKFQKDHIFAKNAFIKNIIA